MPVNPKFLAARAAERRNRLLAHARPILPLVLPLRGRGARAFSVPQRLLTERMRLDLELAENAFVTGARPLLGDVFNLLWRMHPEFAVPCAERLFAVRQLDGRRFRFLRVWYAFGSLRTARIHRWLTRRVAACDLFAAERLIRERLDDAEQDAPGYDGSCSGRRSLAAPEFCYYDELVSFFGETYHLAPDEVLDLPRALVLQIYRNRVLSQPDGELNVFAPSDVLLSAA